MTPATGAYGYAMASNYNGVPRPAVVFCKERRRSAWSSVARPGTTWWPAMPADVGPIGLLGTGTVGAAFRDLVVERAEAIAAASGRRPEIAGVLRRSEGDFDQILEDSEIVVELIGGTEPARDYVLRALRAGRHVVTANKQLIAQHGDELFDAGPRGGGPASLRGGCRGRGAGHPGDPGEPRRDRDHQGLRDRQRDDELHPLGDDQHRRDRMRTPCERAQELGYAEADPTDDVEGADAAAKMAILARLAFGAPVALDDVSYQGITEIQPDDIAYAKELGLSLKLLGIAERRDGGLSVRVFPCFLYPHHPLAPVEGPFNAVMVQAPAITEITMSGPGAGGIETASAVLGDVVLDPLGSRPGSCRSGAARDRPRHQLVVLPPPRGSRPSRGPCPDRGSAGPQRGLGAKRRPARAWAMTPAW